MSTISTVLIVDDEPSNIDIIRAILPDGLKAKVAISGKLAVKISTKQMPDLILMDVQMPEMSGIETNALIRALPGGDKTKIVYVSASELSPDKPTENGFILKPANAEKLNEVINSLFNTNY